MLDPGSNDPSETSDSDGSVVLSAYSKQIEKKESQRAKSSTTLEREPEPLPSSTYESENKPEKEKAEEG